MQQRKRKLPQTKLSFVSKLSFENTPHTTRILHITSFFHPHVGGSQRYMEELFTHLIRNYPNTRVDVLCYNTDNAASEEQYRGLTVYRIPCWQIIPGRFNLPYPWALLSMLNRLSKNAYTHVHTHLRFFDTTWWAWMYAKRISAKSIFTEHVATHPTHQWALVRFLSWLADKTLARWTVPHYDSITTTNSTAAQFLKQEIGIRKPIAIVYGGVDTKEFSPRRDEKRRDIVVTFVGRLIWTKGVTFLYKAIQSMQDSLPANVRFVFVGDGELTPWVKEQITQDHLEDRIRLAGSLPSDAVRDTLRQSDIVVHPSYHNEGFPNVILEAGACGCYVIATDVGGTKEIINDGKTGTIIAQKDSTAIVDAITWALAHPLERNTMARKLREEIVKQFDWNSICNVYYELL